MSYGWTLYINDRLHAKFYSADLGSAWIGSANLTERGMGIAEKPNHELLVFVPELPQSTRLWLHRLITESRLVTPELYEWYRDWLVRQPKPPGTEQEVVPPAPDVPDPFLTSQLPGSDSPRALWDAVTHPDAAADWDAVCAAEHDLALYNIPACEDYPAFHKALRERFLTHPFVAAFYSALPKTGFLFGTAKKWIQDTCTDVPRPYRKDLSQLVQALYTWFLSLAPDIVTVRQPRHSQVIAPTDHAQPGSAGLCLALWQEEIRTLRVDTEGGAKKPFKPLLLLMLLARAQSGGQNLFVFREMEHRLAELMREFGPEKAESDPRFPFWHLRSARLWRLVGEDRLLEHLVQGGNRPTREAMREFAVGKVTPLYWDQLARYPECIPALVQSLLNEYFPAEVWQTLAVRVGVSMPAEPAG